MPFFSLPANHNKTIDRFSRLTYAYEQIKRIMPHQNDKIIKKAIEVLNNGGIIAFPTDTVYGIGCDASNEKTVKRIYKIKKRNIKKPLIMFIGRKSELNKYVYISSIGKSLVKNFWPGALTIIFRLRERAKNKVPLIEHNSTISIRIPDSEPILTLLKQYNKPLATTSANIEGEAPPTNYKDIKLEVDLVIPGTCGKIPSTIIDISSDKLNILREGKITSVQIYNCLKK